MLKSEAYFQMLNSQLHFDMEEFDWQLAQIFVNEQYHISLNYSRLIISMI